MKRGQKLIATTDIRNSLGTLMCNNGDELDLIEVETLPQVQYPYCVWCENTQKEFCISDREFKILL